MASELYEVFVKDPALKEVFRELGRRLSFGSVVDGQKAGNFDAKHIVITFESANTEHTIEHGLARIPVGMIQTSDCKAGTVFGLRIEATKDATSKCLYLKCSEAKTVGLIIW